MTASRRARYSHFQLLSIIFLGFVLSVSAFAAEAIRGYTILLREPAAGGRVSLGLRAANGRVEMKRAEFRELANAVGASQLPIRAALRAKGIEVVYASNLSVNAVFVQATRSQARELTKLAGVRKVIRTPRYRMLLNEADDIVRVPQAWTQVGGAGSAGAGIRIAVIDSGIDMTHPALVDAGLTPPAGFPKARPEDLAFTSSKVIAARSYVELLSSFDPEFSRPDDTSPRDRVGHGTSIAMIAAGMPVSSPVGTLTGVAPKAFLGNYKVFGSPDMNDFSNAAAIVAAIDDAIIDGMDIISMSLGGIAQFPFDAEGEVCFSDEGVICDPVAQAAQSAAVDFGLVVVAAAGNAGSFGEQSFPALNSIGSPASAPAVIAVGATVNARELLRSVRFGGQSVIAKSGTGPKPAGPLTARAVNMATLGDAKGCALLPEGSMAGVIAVSERGECDFEIKVANASEAGAIGMIVTNLPGQDDPFVMVNLETTDIPAFMIGGTAGQQLRSAISGSPQLNVTLDPSFTTRSFATDQVAPFSSRGPTPDNILKPDLVAPGTFIYSAAQQFDSNGDTFDKSGFTAVDGTSFSAPFVAGAAALVWQNNPSFTSAQVKSALVNNAALSVIEDGAVARVTSAGAGMLDAEAAVSPVATAEPATMSFGILELATFPIENTLRITNTSGQSGTFRLAVEPRDTDANASVQVNGGAQTQVQLASGASADVTVALSGSLPQPGVYEGIIHVVRTSGGEDTRVPYFYAVSDGVPFNTFAIAGTGVIGTVNEPNPELLIARVIDQYGQPVPDVATTFTMTDGGGSIFSADEQTDFYGVVAADVDFGPTVGFQDFEADIGGLKVPFLNSARAKPAINAIVNSAGFAPNRRVAPGSIVSVFGTGLAEFVGVPKSTPLPIALKHVSIGFHFEESNLSVPGRFYFTSNGQLNVQVPWEFAGLNFAIVKVRIEDSFSNTFTLDLSDYAPGVFTDFSAENRAIVTHLNGSLVTRQNPASPNETVVVWGTGIGPVDVAQKTGEPASGTALARTRIMPQITIAGSTCNVLFSGLTPGFAGLYQMNITLPPNLPSGDQPLLVNSNGIASNATVIAIR